jgi:uncharacterized tellurite resistance protein B-like protein
MRLRVLLTSLGLGSSGPKNEDDPFIRRLEEHLRDAGPERLEYLAGFAGQLARVAEADDGISPAEAKLIAAQLCEFARISDSEAKLIVDLLRKEFEVLRSVQSHVLNRAVNAHATDAEKKQVIDCLYAVAAADDLVSDIEEQEIRRIAGALLVSHGELMEIRARYRDRIEALQLIKRGRTPTSA